MTPFLKHKLNEHIDISLLAGFIAAVESVPGNLKVVLPARGTVGNLLDLHMPLNKDVMLGTDYDFYSVHQATNGGWLDVIPDYGQVVVNNFVATSAENATFMRNQLLPLAGLDGDSYALGWCDCASCHPRWDAEDYISAFGKAMGLNWCNIAVTPTRPRDSMYEHVKERWIVAVTYPGMLTVLFDNQFGFYVP